VYVFAFLIENMCCYAVFKTNLANKSFAIWENLPNFCPIAMEFFSSVLMATAKLRGYLALKSIYVGVLNGSLAMSVTFQKFHFLISHLQATGNSLTILRLEKP